MQNGVQNGYATHTVRMSVTTNLSKKVECLIEGVAARVFVRDEQVWPAVGSAVAMHFPCKIAIKYCLYGLPLSSKCAFEPEK